MSYRTFYPCVILYNSSVIWAQHDYLLPLKLKESCLFLNCGYKIISVFFCLFVRSFIYFCVRQSCQPKPCLEVPLSVRRETHFRVRSSLLSARVSIFTFSAPKKGRNICPTPVEESRQRSFVSWLQRLQVRPRFFVTWRLSGLGFHLSLPQASLPSAMVCLLCSIHCQAAGTARTTSSPLRFKLLLFSTTVWGKYTFNLTQYSVR